MTEYMVIATSLVLALACFVYWDGYKGSGNFKTVLEARTYQVIETLQQPTP